jgi:hypothetical protein
MLEAVVEAAALAEARVKASPLAQAAFTAIMAAQRYLIQAAVGAARRLRLEALLIPAAAVVLE